MENSAAKPWLNTKWGIVFLSYIGVLVVISILAYKSQLSGLLTQHDKLGHFVLFGAAGLLAHLALNQRCWNIQALLIPIGPCLIAALVIVDELCQALSPNRTAGWPDLVANWLGIFVFTSVGMFLLKRLKD